MAVNILNKIFTFKKQEELLNADEYYEIGFDFLQQNELQKAIYAFEKAVENDPKHIKAYQQLYQISLEAKQFDQAISYIQKILELKKEANYYFDLGKLYFIIKNDNEAYKNFYNAFHLDLKTRFEVDEYVNEAKDLIIKSILDLSKEYENNIEIKILCYEKIVSLFPQEYKYIYEIGIIYFDNNKYDLALQYFNRLIRNTKEFIKAYFYLGTIYQKRTQFQAAIDNFQEYLKSNPNDSEVITNFSICLYETGQTEQAIQYFGKALELEPKNVLAYIFLSKIYIDRKEYDKAEKILKIGLEKVPDSLELKQQYGFLLYDLQRFGDSIECFTEIVKTQPKNIKAQVFLGKSYIKTADYDKAISRYHEIIKLDPKYFKAYSSLGLAHKKKNQFDNAIKYFLYALKVSNVFFPELLKKAEELDNKQDYYELLEVYKEIIQHYID
ncbi:MAG TPA: tetratricopeptide repeat protein, partial [Ignavibacteriales bacterium]|nr:tetratricopeptide repeat protein [Ignavibacteriales bacterium]